MAKTIIQVNNLHKYFGEYHILKGIDLAVSEGELVSIIGGSGCGKTTLLRCLNCLELLDQGSILIGDIHLERTHENASTKAKQTDDAVYQELKNEIFAIRNKVGMLFQSYNLFPHLSVLENVTIAPIKVKGLHKNDAEKIAINNLNKVGMDKYADRKPYQLSGGQAQRVAIARALAMNPQVMLYDEPTAALDPNLVDEIFTVVNTLHNEGMTQIVVTHAMNFARKASDRVVYMEDGRIIEINSAQELFDKPIRPETKKYLSTIS